MLSRNSVRRTRRSRSVSGMSASDTEAAITTAASVGCGRSWRRPGKNSRMSAIAAAPTRPVSWVFAPACSATAVRDPLVLTGNPWNSPAARFAAPIPIISFCPSISSPLRAANDDAVEMVSVSDTRAIPSAPPASSPMSDSPMSGTVKGGNPWGSTPTTSTPRSARSKATAARMESHHGDEDAGGLRQPALQAHDHDQPEHADGECGPHGVPVGQSRDETRELGPEAVAVHREPEELRELADQDRQRQPVHVADDRGLRDQIGDEAQPGNAGGRDDGPDEECERGPERDCPRRVALRGDQREDGGGDHRPERRVGPQHQDPRGPEHGVGDKAEDGRVQARDRGEARQLRVGHPLRHQERGQDQPGHDVVAQPTRLVRRQVRQPRRRGGPHGPELRRAAPAFASFTARSSCWSGQRRPRPRRPHHPDGVSPRGTPPRLWPPSMGVG